MVHTASTQLKPGEDNVLAALDARPATRFYIRLFEKQARHAG